MSTTVNLRKLLHRKAWEMCTPSPVNSAAGSFVVSDKYNLLPNSLAYMVGGVSAIYRYDGDQDSWVQIPNSGITGTFGAGACGEIRVMGALGGVFTQTVTAGGTASLTTNKTIVRNLAGRRIRVVAGTGLGFDGTVLSNTIGANSVITTSGSTVFDATTQFQVFSGSLWFFCPGAGTVGFSVYDLATNSWTARSVTGIATTFGTDGQLVSTLGSAASYDSSTATSATSTTLTNSGKSWLTNQWANYQVRITSGTGVGQIRTISSNTATAITVSTAWTVTPDATSVYRFEGNEDYFYLIGNNAVTLYRYQVSTNTWSTLTPTAARSGAGAAGLTCNWIDNVSSWILGSNGQPVPLTSTSTLYKQNGRYLFSFRGGATSTLDVYDIAANTWISDVSYGNKMETFTTASSSIDFDGKIFIQKEATGRIFMFNIEDWVMQSFAYCPVPQGTAVAGQKMFLLTYSDGVDIDFLYTQRHTGAELMRMMVI